MGTVEAALEIEQETKSEREGAEGAEGAGHAESADHAEGGGGAERRPSAFQRVVALKRLLPDAARDSRRVEMFLREARLAAMLDHPNVVRAYDYGEVDGELFLAMEYVEGQALSRVLRALAEAKADLGAPLTAHVLAEVCDGLHAAHELRDEAGQPLLLVHRDVSPQNVMLGYDGHVRLLDFGVAKIEAESVTKTGEVKGKTAYMSPEQAMGDAIDRRSDLFGVGAVLFECLALRRMWGDGTDMDVIRKLALEKPPQLEAAVPGAPAALCALYTQLVSRDAKDRPATAKDVAEALRALVPQGRDAASRDLEKLLAEHFGEQAAEQRARLNRSLEDVAPDQARELRESAIPTSGPASSPVLREPDIADATGANRLVTGDGRARGQGVADPTPEPKSRLWLALVALAAAALVIWRLTSPADDPKPVTTTPPVPAAPSAPPPSATVPLGTVITHPVVSAPIASAALGATATATATATALPSPPSSNVPRVIAQPTTPVRAGADAGAKLAPTTTTTTTATTKPTATSRPPPDVDDHPF